MGYLIQSHKMGQWKARKVQKGLRASRESGRKKGLVPPVWAKHMAKAARSYKLDRYPEWCRICNGDKIKWTGAK